MYTVCSVYLRKIMRNTKHVKESEMTLELGHLLHLALHPKPKINNLFWGQWSYYLVPRIKIYK